MYWLENNWPILAIVALVGFSIWGTVIVAEAETERKNVFMTECKLDHKEYECTAMWRAGENHTTVVPMPVYVGR